MDQQNRQELERQLDLITSMVREGRRTTEYWGWSFLLWGAALLIATGWSSATGRSEIAWPVTIAVAVALSRMIAAKRRAARPTTFVSRAMSAIWTGVGVALIVFCFSVAFSGNYQMQAFLAAVESMLGAANLASGIILQWRMQSVVAGLWFAAAIATCLVPAALVGYIFIAMVLAGLVLFGIYLMVRESRDQTRLARA